MIKLFITSALCLTASLSANALSSEMAPHQTPAISIFEDDIKTNNRVVLNPILAKDARIGLARIDKGRFITTPYQEADDWNALAQTLTQELHPIKPSIYLNVTPEIDMDGQDTNNKIDEIRLAAVESGLPYVLIYGIFDDAHFASFGGKALHETGLTVKVGCQSWQRGDAKALLVDSYTGEVIDAVTTWAPDMPALTKDIRQMLSTLSEPNISA